MSQVVDPRSSVTLPVSVHDGQMSSLELIGLSPTFQSLILIFVVGRSKQPCTASKDLASRHCSKSVLNSPPNPPTQKTAPMRFSAILLVVVFTLAACCHGFANAGDASRKNLMSASNRVDDRHAPALRKLKDNAAIDTEDEERGFSGFSKLKTLLADVPYLNKLKALVGKNPDINKVKAAAEKSPEVKNLKAAVGNTPIKLTEKDAAKVLKEVKKRHPAVSVALSVLKMLAVVGVISLTTGFLVYIHENYF